MNSPGPADQFRDEELVAAQLTGESVAPGFVPGLVDEEVYKKRLRPWVFRYRKKAIDHLTQREMVVLGVIETLRKPLLDRYFVGSALLGTHTFFMFFLPLFIWYGRVDAGVRFLFNLALGVYLSSWAKDLFCIPRPFSPPITRLSLSTHADEYGFPSTHSTNAVSMALLLSFETRRLGTLSVETQWAVDTLAVAFALSVTLGRTYAGMHSFLDVGFGSLLGLTITLAYERLDPYISAWVLLDPFMVSTLSTVIVLILSFVRPHPVEPCPCWEDAIAFISVVLGYVYGKTWIRIPLDRLTVGYDATTLTGQSLYVTALVAKLVIGASLIVLWRIVSKGICQFIVPPVVALFISRPDPATLKPDPDTHIIQDVFSDNVVYLSKIVVYAGIGFLATTGSVLLFLFLGLSVSTH